MQSCVQNITTVRYLLDLHEPHADKHYLTATKLDSRNREGMFQQDCVRAHTSKATIAWLDANIKHFYAKNFIEYS